MDRLDKSFIAGHILHASELNEVVDKLNEVVSAGNTGAEEITKLKEKDAEIAVSIESINETTDALSAEDARLGEHVANLYDTAEHLSSNMYAMAAWRKEAETDIGTLKTDAASLNEEVDNIKSSQETKSEDEFAQMEQEGTLDPNKTYFIY